jgi:endonuclease/exonuclease/phosphatase family metal-dependent hydrolase
MIIKILSYNIHKGFDWKNRNYLIKEMKDFITSSEADIVFLQEVVGKNRKYQGQGIIDSQFEYLADQIWTHYSYGRNAVYDHGHHGNLILSKFPIESFENIDISTNQIEQRGFLICKISLPLNKQNENHFFYAACSHLNLLHTGRVLQYQKIKDYILSKNIDYSTPLLIAGDFNDWNKKCTQVFEIDLNMQDVHKKTHGHFAKTFPAFFPLLCLDRIYVKNLRIIDTKILEPKISHNILTHLSDHLALFCEVEID